MTKKIHISPTGPMPCKADPTKPRSTGCGYPDSPHFDDMASAEAAFAKIQGGAIVATMSKDTKKRGGTGERDMTHVTMSGTRANSTPLQKNLDQKELDELLKNMEQAGFFSSETAREYANHEIQNGRHNEQWFSNGIIEVKIRRTAIPERPFALVNHQRSFHKTVDKLFFP